MLSIFVDLNIVKLTIDQNTPALQRTGDLALVREMK